MGKQKKRRSKTHLPAVSKLNSSAGATPENTTSTGLPLEFKENVFEGLDITSLLNKDFPKADDNLSMKSHVSNKSIKGVITKKEKLKLRREMLLKKIDFVSHLKKDNRLRKKNKKIPIIGDTKPLFDNLPSLEHLLKLTDESKSNHMRKPKKRAIEKSKKIQKNVIQNISMYKKLLKNPALTKNPFEAISGHLNAIMEQERKFAENSK